MTTDENFLRVARQEVRVLTEQRNAAMGMADAWRAKAEKILGMLEEEVQKNIRLRAEVARLKEAK